MRVFAGAMAVIAIVWAALGQPLAATLCLISALAFLVIARRS